MDQGNQGEKFVMQDRRVPETSRVTEDEFKAYAFGGTNYVKEGNMLLLDDKQGRNKRSNFIQRMSESIIKKYVDFLLEIQSAAPGSQSISPDTKENIMSKCMQLFGKPV